MSHARSHDWIKSTLGHGETMCRNCSITNREAAVLGCLDVCDAAPVPSGQTVIEAASNNFGLTVADLDERREAIARLVGKHLGPYLAISPTARYEAIVREFIRELLASGLVQDEAAIRADEREKCAELADMHYEPVATEIAAAIRDGGEA